jgi:CRISPR-associated protein Csy1
VVSLIDVQTACSTACVINRTGDYTNVRIREARDEYIDALIDLLFVVASELQRDTWQNWTLRAND